MIKREYILTLSLFIFGCSKPSDKTRFEQLLFEREYDGQTAIDFSKSSDNLISNINSLYNIDLCDTIYSVFGKVMTAENRRTQISFDVFEGCYPHLPSLGMIEIFIKTNDDVRIDLEYCNLDSISFYVNTELESRLGEKKNVDIQLRFEWGEVNTELIESVFKQSFAAVKAFANTKSQQWYGQQLDELSEEEFHFFQTCFTVSPTITNVRPDLPME